MGRPRAQSAARMGNCGMNWSDDPGPECAQFSMYTLQNLAESLHRGVEAVIDAMMGGATPYQSPWLWNVISNRII